MKTHFFYIIMSFLLIPYYAEAQKITLGSCTTKDGGSYKGEMLGSKPNGKGETTYKNGDVYKGVSGPPARKGHFLFHEQQ